MRAAVLSDVSGYSDENVALHARKPAQQTISRRAHAANPHVRRMMFVEVTNRALYIEPMTQMRASDLFQSAIRADRGCGCEQDRIRKGVRALIH